MIPTRILQVFGILNFGGAEMMLISLYRHIDKTIVQFDFVKHTNDKCEFDDEILAMGGRVFCCPKYTGKNHFKYQKWWNDFFMKHSEYHIIHSHISSTAAIILSIAKKYDLFTIAHSHNTSSGFGISAKVKDIMQFPIRFIADWFFSCSHEAGRWLFGNKVISGSNYRILKNAIDIQSFNDKLIVRKEVRDEFGLNGYFVIGHIGRFADQKNHMYLVDIFKYVFAKNSAARLLLVGDGPLKPDVERKVAAFGLSKYVVFAGVRNDVPKLLQAMDVFVFPSKFEGLGIVVIEAQITGLHCIVSDATPKEVAVTDLVDFIPLSMAPRLWAEKILKYDINIKRNYRFEEIIAAGYDVRETAKELQEFYTNVAISKTIENYKHD